MSADSSLRLRVGTAGGDQPQTFGNEPAPIPQVFNGATLPSVDVSRSAIAGEGISVSGVVGFDCPVCVVDREVRVVATASHLDEPIIRNVGKLSGRGETATFSLTIPAPQSANQTVTIRLKAEHNPPGPAGWDTDTTRGPFSVNVNTQSQQAAEGVIQTIPWVVGGTAVGAGAAHLTDRPLVAGGVAGGGGGLAASVLSDQVGPIDVVPEFPTTAVIALTGLLGAGALFLAQTGELTGLGD